MKKLKNFPAKIEADVLVLDWGIGGLSVYNEVRKLIPNCGIVYFSDSGNTPYGKMSRSQLGHQVYEIIFWFHHVYQIKNFIVACNAASTVLPLLQNRFDKLGVKVTGVIEHGVSAIVKSNFKSVGVIGGKRTILSKSYTKPFRNKANFEVVGRIAQPLSGLIEKGDIAGEKIFTELSKILYPIRNVDLLVLACTHYPAISQQIRFFMPNAALLDPGQATARYVKTYWKLMSQSRTPKFTFFTTGSAVAMQKSAQLAFGNKIKKIFEVEL